MIPIDWYHSVWSDLEASNEILRARCKAGLSRLQLAQPGASSGLRIEKVSKDITELKISWNKQEFRFLFFYHEGRICILHFFQKKTKKTPPKEIDLAIARAKDIKLDRATIHNGDH